VSHPALDAFGRLVLLADAPPEQRVEDARAIIEQTVLDEAVKRDFARSASRQRGVTLSDQENEGIRQARIDDLVDLLGFSGEAEVKLVPRRGFIRRELSYLTDDEVVSVVHRLRRRAMSDDDIGRAVVERLPADRRDRIAGRLG
jgi:hypothetical protein